MFPKRHCQESVIQDEKLFFANSFFANCFCKFFMLKMFLSNFTENCFLAFLVLVSAGFPFLICFRRVPETMDMRLQSFAWSSKIILFFFGSNICTHFVADLPSSAFDVSSMPCKQESEKTHSLWLGGLPALVDDSC